MQGYDPYRHVGPYSSSSNLSPLAPPFTVEPSFLGSAHDDQHYAYTTRPSHDNWLQLNSQAYESNSLFLNPNPVVTSSPSDNTGIDPVSAYGHSMNNSLFNSPSGNWPYHPHYPPPAAFVGSGSSTSFDVNENRSVLWGAKSDSEPWKAKGKDVNVSASPSYATVVSRGIFSNDGFGFSAREEPSRVWPEKPVESLAGNLFVGSRETKSPVGKLSSKSKEKSRDTPFDMSRINPDPFKEMSYNITPSPDFANESWTQLTPSIPSYGRYFTGGDSYRSDPLCFYPAASKSSLDQIHESAAIIGKPTMLTSRSALTSTSPTEPPMDAWQRKEGYTWDTPSNMGRSPVMDEISDCYVGPSSINAVEEYVDPLASSGKSTTITPTNLLTSMSPIECHRDVRQKKEGSVVDSSSSMGCGPGMSEISESYGGTRCINNGVEEYVGPSLLNDVVPQLYSPAPTADPSRHVAKAENNGQVTNFDPPGTLLTADTGVGDSVDCSSEVTEQFNPGVDSPCWKGASDSRYSLFGASDVGAADTPAKILEGCGTLNIQGLQEPPVSSDTSVAFSKETQKNDFSREKPRTDKCYGEDGSPSLLEQVFPVASLPSGDQHSSIPKLGPNHLLELKIRALQDLVSQQKHIFRKRIQRNYNCYGKDASSSLLDQAFPFVNQPSGFHQLSMPKLGPDQLQYSNKNENQVCDHSNTGDGSDLESLQKNVFCYDERTASRQASCEVRIANPGIGKLPEPVVQPSTSTKYPRGDVGTVVDMMQNQLPRVGMVVNIIHNLSEVLLSYCCKDEVAPKEQDHVVIKQVIQNLETCLERVDTTRPSPKTQFPQCDMSKCSEKPSDADKETAAGGSQATHYSLGTEPGRFQAASTEIMDVESRGRIQNASGGKSFTMDNSQPLPFPSGGSELEQDDMTKGIKIILEENFSDEDDKEQEPHNMLYKNLWLEAEAALCTVNYKARYARMKLEMEKYKQHKKKGELLDGEKQPSSDGPVEIRSVNVVPKSRGSEDNEVANVQMQDDNKFIAVNHPENMVELKSQETEDGQVADVLMQDHTESTGYPDNIVESKSKETEDREVAPITKPAHRESSTGGHTENLETSVMARFHILKSRINSRVPINKEGQQHDSVHAGTQETYSHPGNMQSAEDIVMKPQQPKLVNLNFSDVKNPLHFMSENSEVDYSRYMDQYDSKYPSPFIRDNSKLNINTHMDHFSVKQAVDSPGYLEPIRDLAEFCAMQSARSNSSMDQYCGGDYDSNSPSSDWEHVLKEGTWPV